MHRNYLLFSALTLVVSIGSAAYALTAQANVQQSSENCYMQNKFGYQVDLSTICGRSSEATPTVKIDANTPVPIDLVGSDKPSALWNTIPDLKNPPSQGRTYKQAPPTQVEVLSGQEAK